MKHLNDVCKIDGAKVPAVDCIIGGSPCQDLSVAGLRRGMKHSELGDNETTRSGLFMEQIRICKEMRESSARTDNNRRVAQPRYMVWENVPGAFSSNNGEDFRCVLEEVARISESSVTIPRPEKGKWGTSGVIVGDTWSIAWRTFDAQFWNVPQRRRRICLVADFDGHTAADIVFDQQHGSTLDNDDESLEEYFGVGCGQEVPSFCKSLSGHSHKSEQAREESSSTSGEGSDAGNCFCIQGSGLTSQQAHGSGVNEDVAFKVNATDQHGVAYTLQDREGAPGGGKGPLVQTDLASSLRTNNYMTVFQPVPEVFSAHGYGQYEAMNTLGTLASEQNHHVRGDTSLVVEPVPFRKTAHPMSADEAQGWEEAALSDTLSTFDVSESRIPTVVVDEDRGGIVSERHDERGSQMTEDGISDPLMSADYKQPITIAYAADKVGSLCYDDYKGANNQYVDQDKLLVLQEQEVISLGRDAIEQGKNAQWQPEIRNDGRRNTIIAKGVGGVAYKDAIEEPRYIVRRLTPLECERLQGLPSVKKIDISQMTKDEYIAYAIYNGDIIVDAENGKIFTTRGPGGIKLEKPRELAGTDCHGYLSSKITCKNTKLNCRHHRIVWISKNGIIPEGYVIDHINNNKKDNRISNLQLLTPQANSTKAKNDGLYLTGEENKATKLAPELRDEIAFLYDVSDLTIRELAKLYGISKSRVGQIIKEVGWTDIGEYVDSKGKKCQTRDSHRYKALGNGIATPSWYWVLCRMSCFLGERPTLASLFDGVGSYPWLWEMINGKGTAIWCSEVDEFAIAVSKYHFPDESEVT